MPLLACTLTLHGYYSSDPGHTRVTNVRQAFASPALILLFALVLLFNAPRPADAQGFRARPHTLSETVEIGQSHICMKFLITR